MVVVGWVGRGFYAVGRVSLTQNRVGELFLNVKMLMVRRGGRKGRRRGREVWEGGAFSMSCFSQVQKYHAVAQCCCYAIEECTAVSSRARGSCFCRHELPRVPNKLKTPAHPSQSPSHPSFCRTGTAQLAGLAVHNRT